jgi:hypothetical protein
MYETGVIDREKKFPYINDDEKIHDSRNCALTMKPYMMAGAVSYFFIL